MRLLPCCLWNFARASRYVRFARVLPSTEFNSCFRVLKWNFSVSMAKSGFHDSGGTILQIPYLLASGLIFLMYSMGSFHSASVGQYVGASGRSCGRHFFLTGSLGAVGWSLRSTEERSRGALVMALRDFGGFVGW